MADIVYLPSICLCSI